MIPETLQAFMDCLAKKKRAKQKIEKKMAAISHALIAAIRPRSFVSSILHGLALFIHRKFGSKSLIQLLASLGFSGNYHEAQQLEMSLVYHPKAPALKDVFCQYVFDNADFNISTIDGWNTFPCMGGIKCVTPASALPIPQEIKRITSLPPATEVGNLELQIWNGPTNTLQHLTVLDLDRIHPLPHDIDKTHKNSL